MKPRLALWFAIGLLVASLAGGQPETQLDLAQLPGEPDGLFRLYGSNGNGSLGLPVAAGDLDGDGHGDLAAAFIQASPGFRFRAGEVDVVFGDGRIEGFVDSAVDDPRMLRFFGGGIQETAGAEIWIDDVTGDGVADLLICRQNYTPGPGRLGAGALTVISGGPHLKELAELEEPVDLASIGALPHTTIVGIAAADRLGIWVRTGDVDGDGVADLIVGADQADVGAEQNRGEAWIFRGGPQLANAGTVDLAVTGTAAFAGQTARLTPPDNSADFHFGATCILADLDANGTAEAIVAATLNRGGAILGPPGAPPGSAPGNGGPPHGQVFIAWDDHFPEAPWPPTGVEIPLESSPGTTTRLYGAQGNVSFGEELIGGHDFDGDQKSDLFLGDLAGDGSPAGTLPASGLGWVVFDAASLKGRTIEFDALPPDLTWTKILGSAAGDLAADTAAAGDFNGDGWHDLAITSPHADAPGRTSAGVVHIAMGGSPWPQVLDLAELPTPEVLRVTEVLGAQGSTPGDLGDTLGYSAAAYDLDGDHRSDLITNEMVGNGLAPGTIDVGNLIAISGQLLAPTCVPTVASACLLDGRFRVEGEMQTFSTQPVVVFQAAVMEIEGRAETEFAAFFESFNPGNFELGVKMVSACSANVPPPQRGVWLFIGGLTNAETTIRVQDTANPGSQLVWTNPQGELVQSFALTPAFGCAGPHQPECQRDATTACLLDRFRITGEMKNFASPPTTFAANVMSFDGRAESDQAVFFDSFTRGNFEVGVKMVDACSLPEGHPQRGYWTFYGGLTNAESRFQITDTKTGAVDRWTVEPGVLPRSEARTPAFPCD